MVSFSDADMPENLAADVPAVALRGQLGRYHSHPCPDQRDASILSPLTLSR